MPSTAVRTAHSRVPSPHIETLTRAVPSDDCHAPAGDNARGPAKAEFAKTRAAQINVARSRYKRVASHSCCRYARRPRRLAKGMPYLSIAGERALGIWSQPQPNNAGFLVWLLASGGGFLSPDVGPLQSEGSDHDRKSTTTPFETILASSSASQLVSRTQPWEAALSIIDGSGVP